MICDTPPSQDISTHQIWNSYLKEYRRYVPDTMQFLETRSEVKFKVTVTQLWYATDRHPKMHPHTKFEIPTSNNKIAIRGDGKSPDQKVIDMQLQTANLVYIFDVIILSVTANKSGRLTVETSFLPLNSSKGGTLKCKP